MLVIDELKLNRHKFVKLPKNRDLFARVGERLPSSFPSSEKPVPLNMSKLDQVEYLDNLERNAIREELYQSYLKSLDFQEKNSVSEPEPPNPE